MFKKFLLTTAFIFSIFQTEVSAQSLGNPVGTLGIQNANTVAITGGTINGVTLGATTPVISLDTPAINVIGLHGGDLQLRVTGIPRYLEFFADDNVDLFLPSAGTALQPVTGFPLYIINDSGALIGEFDPTTLITSLGGAQGSESFRVLPAGPVMIGSSSIVGSLGNLGLPKITASANAPGAAKIKLEAVTGTNAGTCKVQIYAGTSVTPLVFADNIGSGC